jgi:hypothetical protein
MADLERKAMLRQFQAPLQVEASGSVLDVARAAAAKLSDLQRAHSRQKSEALANLAVELNGRVEAKLRTLSSGLVSTFRGVDKDTSAWVKSANVGQPDAGQYHGQLVKLARRNDFFANLSEGSWWTTLTLKLFDERLRLLVAFVRVGSGDTGVGTILIQSERLFRDQADQSPLYEWLFQPTDLDQVAVTADLNFEDVWPDVDHLVDRCLSAAIAAFTRTLL